MWIVIAYLLHHENYLVVVVVAIVLLIDSIVLLTWWNGFKWLEDQKINVDGILDWCAKVSWGSLSSMNATVPFVVIFSTSCLSFEF